jgi:hypothetical protein
MGANTRIQVKVLKAVEDVIEVDAIAIYDAVMEAQKTDGVIRVLGVKYELENDWIIV